jgi:hypothetical protein
VESDGAGLADGNRARRLPDGCYEISTDASAPAVITDRQPFSRKLTPVRWVDPGVKSGDRHGRDLAHNRVQQVGGDGADGLCGASVRCARNRQDRASPLPSQRAPLSWPAPMLINLAPVACHVGNRFGSQLVNQPQDLGEQPSAKGNRDCIINVRF